MNMFRCDLCVLRETGPCHAAACVRHGAAPARPWLCLSGWARGASASSMDLQGGGGGLYLITCDITGPGYQQMTEGALRVGESKRLLGAVYARYDVSVCELSSERGPGQACHRESCRSARFPAVCCR